MTNWTIHDKRYQKIYTQWFSEWSAINEPSNATIHSILLEIRVSLISEIWKNVLPDFPTRFPPRIPILKGLSSDDSFMFKTTFQAMKWMLEDPRVYDLIKRGVLLALRDLSFFSGQDMFPKQCFAKIDGSENRDNSYVLLLYDSRDMFFVNDQQTSKLLSEQSSSSLCPVDRRNEVSVTWKDSESSCDSITWSTRRECNIQMKNERRTSCV